MTFYSFQIDALIHEKCSIVFGDVKLQKGYVSRKPIDILRREVHVASGNRKGEYYILLPNYKSTRYCYRQYLKKIKRSEKNA